MGSGIACRMLRAWAFAAGALAGLALAQDSVLEVIPLRYRTVEEVVRLVQPLLAPGGTVSGMQGQLIVRTSPENLKEIRRVLESVDVAPRRLRVTVRREGAATREAREAELSGRIGGRRAEVAFPEGEERSGGHVVLRSSDARMGARVLESLAGERDRDVQSVQVLEGGEAFIQAGVSIPVREREVRRTVVGGRVVEQVVESTRYRDFVTGFYVRPRLAGERVIVEISPRRATPEREPTGRIRVEGTTTTVTGRLGEWIEIGGSALQSEEARSSLLGAGASGSSDAVRFSIRVEELP